MSVLIKSDRDKKWSNMDLNPPNRSSHSAMGRHSFFPHLHLFKFFSSVSCQALYCVPWGHRGGQDSVLASREFKVLTPSPKFTLFLSQWFLPWKGLPIHAFLQTWNLLPSLSLSIWSKCPVEITSPSLCFHIYEMGITIGLPVK